MSWLKRIFSKDSDPKILQISKVKVHQLDYPPKIILATCKALQGHVELGRYLLDNGYEELFYMTQAALLKEEARTWLMKNGYPHLLAMINAAEGNESALKWLQVHGFEILAHIADAVEGEMESFEWLKANATEDIFIFAVTLKKVKDEIEYNHNDVHSFGKDL